MQKQWISSGILALLLLVTVVSGVQAATIVVAPSGGEYSAIQPAVDAASPGDIVEVQAGTYPGGVVVRTPVTIAGGDGVTVGTGDEEVALAIEADGVTLRGLACEAPAIGIMVNASEASRVEGCSIVAGDTGIMIGGCTNCSVADTRVLADRSGILVTSSPGTDITGAWVNGKMSGITLRDCRDFSLQQTTLPGSDVGIVAERCENGTIEEMTFTDVGAGMLGIGCTDLRIAGSTQTNVVQYLQMYNARGCRVEADSMTGAEYFAADVFSDTVYACGPWAVSGWNFGLVTEEYSVPEGYRQFGDAVNVTFIEEAESFEDPVVFMDAAVSAGELEGYDAETFGFYFPRGGTPDLVGTTTVGEDGSATTSANTTVPGEYVLLARVTEEGPDLFYPLLAVLVVIAVVLGYLVLRRE